MLRFYNCFNTTNTGEEALLSLRLEDWHYYSLLQEWGYFLLQHHSLCGSGGSAVRRTPLKHESSWHDCNGNPSSVFCLIWAGEGSRDTHTLVSDLSVGEQGGPTAPALSLLRGGLSVKRQSLTDLLGRFAHFSNQISLDIICPATRAITAKLMLWQVHRFSKLDEEFRDYVLAKAKNSS